MKNLLTEFSDIDANRNLKRKVLWQMLLMFASLFFVMWASAQSIPDDDDDDIILAGMKPRISLSISDTRPAIPQPASFTLTADAKPSLADPAATITKVDFYLAGNLLTTVTSSPYTYAAVNLPKGVYQFSAVATDTKGRAESAGLRVLVNTPPLLSINSPVANAVLNNVSPISISGVVSDLDGSVTKLEFFYGNTPIGVPINNPTSPFSHTWSNAPSGSHILKAIATDNDGSTTTVNVPVVVNAAPTISITTPGPVATYYVVNTPINFTVNAADSDGTIQRVEYYRNGTLLSTVTSTPFSYQWVNAPMGIHTITAKAVDNNGGETISVAKTVDVDITNLPVCKLHILHQSAALLDAYLLTVACTKGPTSNFFFTGPTFQGARGMGGGNMTGIDIHVVPTTESLDPVPGSNFIRMYPGTHTFWVRSVRTGDNAEGSPVALTATLVANFAPPTVTVTNPVSGGNVAFSGVQPITVSVNGGNLNILHIDLSIQRVDIPNQTEYPIGRIENVNAVSGQFTFPVWNKDDPLKPKLVANAQYKLIARAINMNWISAKGEATFTAVASPPIVQIEQPANNLPAKDEPVILRAQASIDAAGATAGITIQSLQFFNGNTPIAITPTFNNGFYQISWTPPAIGTYLVSARALSSAGVSGNSGGVQITVQAPMPLSASETPLGDANSSPLDNLIGGTGTTVGATAGSFDVSESGSAGYSIPIALPPGTAGMVPSVGLSYSSQGGGGLVGVGWNLTGLSAIHRCPKNYYTDDIKGKVAYEANDAFCLDGQRLIAVATNEYRTERDSYSRIIFNSAANAWTVESKSGLIMHYGTDEQGGAGHARLMAIKYDGTSINSAVKVWALSKTVDRQGNYYLVEYEKDGNDLAQRPIRMRYTGNANAGIVPYASVEFAYDANLPEEQALLYDSAGSVSQQTKILKTIKTQIGTNLVRSYKLAYDVSAQTKRNVLRSVTECGYGVGVTDVNSTDSLCLPPTEFNILTPGASDTTFVQQVIPPVYEEISGQGITRVMDLNGDGKSDFIRYKGNSLWGVRLGGVAGLEQSWSSPGANDNRIVFGDFNGDGLTDFISEAGNIWTLCKSTGVAFNCTTLLRSGQTNDIPPVPTSSNINYTLSGDFDGDGRIDVAFYLGRDISTYVSIWRVCLSTGVGFNCTGPYNGPAEGNDSLGPNGKVVGDFNGDGRADIAGYGYFNSNTNNWQVAFSNFSSGSTSSVGFSMGPLNTPAVFSFPYKSIVADLNGDGLADLVAAEENQGEANRSKWYVCLSKGDGTFSCSYWPGRWYQNVFSVMGDFNGDGRTDIAEYITNSGWNVCQSTGVSFTCQNWGSAVPSAGDTTNYYQFNLAGDFDGNGKTDIAIFQGSPSVNWRVIGATGATPDLMAKAKDGLGKEALFSYKPLTLSGAGSLYTKGTGAVFPALDIQSPMYVVSSMSTNNGIGGMRSFSYTYEALRGHSQGAGLLGFAKRTVKDDLTERTTTTTYLQDFINRIAGVPNETIVTNSAGFILSKKTMSWAGKTPISGMVSTQKIWQIHSTGSTDHTYDPNVSTTTPYLTTTSSTPITSYDDYGNVMSSSVVTSDGFGKSTTTTYDYSLASISNWLIGRPLQVEVQSNAPSASLPPRKSSFTYQTNSHLVQTEIIEPGAGDPTLTLTTTYGYDSVGNRTSTAVSGQGLTGRTSTVSYGDAYKRFATSASNALSHTATSEYMPRFGAVTKTTDANGQYGVSRYDRLGRKVASYSSLGINQSTTYAQGIAGAAMSITTTTSGAPLSVSHVDLLGREIRRDTQDFAWNTVSVTTTYDARGRKLSVTRPNVDALTSAAQPTVATTFTYEADNKIDRLLSETDANGGTTNYAYAGFTGTVTRNPGSAPAQATTRVTNSQGWTTSVTDAAQNTTTYNYDSLGNLTQVNKPGGGMVTMTYDIRSRKKSLVDPDAGTINYSYNAGGELVTEAVAGGRSSTSTYDTLGRLAIRAETANGKTYTTTNVYDCSFAKGKLCSEKLDQPSGSTTRSYARDDKSRVSEVTTVTTAITGTQSREKTFTSQTRYDSLSRPKLYSYPISGLTLRNEYNGLGFTTKVIEQRSGGDITHWQANARNALGQITSMSIGGQIATNVIGQTTTKTYDSIGRVKSISTGTLQAASYEWDLIGNLTRRSDAAANAVNGGNEYFCHDKLNRVTHANAGPLNCTNPPSANFSYDPLGNLTKPGVTVAYQANSNKLLTVNGQTVQYDVGGNIISDGKRTYTYNPYDIPDSITQTHTTGNNPGTYQSQWGFGPDKQRTYELMLKAPVNGGNYAPIGMTWQPSPGHFELDEEINLNGTWVINECRHTIGSPEGNIGVVATNCISGNTMSNSTDRYYLKDHLGSNAGTFKQNILESRASYDVWGMRVESGNAALSGFDTSQRGYTGHEHLAMFGLIHMNGRIYDPLLGRFMQADPIIDEPFNLQSYNRYAYVSNNPLAFTDPTGYSKWTRYRKPVLALAAAMTMQFYVMPALFANVMASTAFQAVATGAASGFAAGGIMGGNLNSALYGAVSGGVGGWTGAMGFDPILARGIEATVGGAISAAQGRGFANGARLPALMYVASELISFATPDIEVYDVTEGAGGTLNPSRVNTISKSGKASINGIKNPFDDALINARNFTNSTDFTLLYNPSRSFLQDGLETFQDTFLGGSKVSRQLRGLLSDASQRGMSIELWAHSQGGAIVASVLKHGVIEGLAVNFKGAPILQSSVAGHSNFKSWEAHPKDFVPMVLGGNGNLSQIIQSVIASPRLFMNGCSSYHSSSTYTGRC
jgi:RHS repeat-associated protein